MDDVGVSRGPQHRTTRNAFVTGTEDNGGDEGQGSGLGHQGG